MLFAVRLLALLGANVLVCCTDDEGERIDGDLEGREAISRLVSRLNEGAVPSRD